MHHGKNIIYREMRQKRLADACMDLYGMITTISRVDTLINDKGEENCQNEIKICNTFCQQAWRRIRRNLLMMDNNNDQTVHELSDYIVDQQAYPFEV